MDAPNDTPVRLGQGDKLRVQAQQHPRLGRLVVGQRDERRLLHPRAGGRRRALQAELLELVSGQDRARRGRLLVRLP